MDLCCTFSWYFSRVQFAAPICSGLFTFWSTSILQKSIIHHHVVSVTGIVSHCQQDEYECMSTISDLMPILVFGLQEEPHKTHRGITHQTNRVGTGFKSRTCEATASLTYYKYYEYFILKETDIRPIMMMKFKNNTNTINPNNNVNFFMHAFHNVCCAFVHNDLSVFSLHNTHPSRSKCGRGFDIPLNGFRWNWEISSFSGWRSQVAPLQRTWRTHCEVPYTFPQVLN